MYAAMVHVFRRGTSTFIRNTAATMSQMSMRMLSVSHHMMAKPDKPKDDQEVNNEPIRFSTSKASHRTWNVSRSMGDHCERPWWKVLPLSAAVVGFLLWCVLRREVNIDEQLEQELYQNLPGLLPDEDEK
ncbi:ubiquinol-cytochrome-c reductase complex assembly factor 4 [Entelurus aequoreus]|uniref:ubiquinol-cytochrome-c reductase complex assembly factor 4 n=1 Tax=Entelurus aequoreus TaxID=161455 RepID=UPI002B1D4807|nr:ubiquinol-cytochrome-c reductase complex assembly factor 4 [Entelurus aequoreus]